MKRALLLSVVAVAVALPSAAFACEGMKQASTAPRAATVAEVAAWKAKNAITPVDANGRTTREKEGVVPGAILLTSSSQYDVTKELPADHASKLVFYCANTQCSAGEAAAKKAMSAGYTDVAVMREGISGWKKAGQPVAKPNS